ncbi:hypothetical protein GIB67_039733 [Kingdonia uniflora]|uniref:Uncharacterized protein n=1 Tax=Kingdonia uniflora TaxID=39325 RepID=A0A7J7MQD1_9MAGN|nr:hypothetical protein GIB67_039733 [Kingdonia uniflora]
MVLCRVFHFEFVPFDEMEKFDFEVVMKSKGAVWDTIVKEHGLFKTKLSEITCFDLANVILKFDFQQICSMNKSRDFGFFGTRIHSRVLKHGCVNFGDEKMKKKDGYEKKMDVDLKVQMLVTMELNEF